MRRSGACMVDWATGSTFGIVVGFPCIGSSKSIFSSPLVLEDFSSRNSHLYSAFRVLGDLLLETSRDRLLGLFLLKFNERVGGVDTLSPDSFLRIAACRSQRKITHLRAPCSDQTNIEPELGRKLLYNFPLAASIFLFKLRGLISVHTSLT